MKIAVTGASGLIGSTLVPTLRADGHDVVRLVRRASTAADEIRWDGRSVAAGTFDDVDAVVHLAGAGVGDKRWTDSHKDAIRSSRVDGTTAVARALAAAAPRPRVLLSGSAIGFYGDTGDRTVDESSPSGDTFLAGVVRDWEAATRPAEEAGVRVVHLRSGVVQAAQGGALEKQLLIWRLGIGGRLGNGRQWVSWISLPDELAAIRFLLTADDVHGPVNLTAPEPVTNAEFGKALGRAVHRPAVMWVPGLALRIVLGEFAAEVLAGQRVLPRRLQEAGFAFAHPTIGVALDAVLRSPGRPPQSATPAA